MESPLCINVERKNTVGNLNEKMNSSVNSTLEDTTPSDSGVQMLDSDTSEIMVESLTSQNGFEMDEVKMSSNAQATTRQIEKIQNQIPELQPIKVEQKDAQIPPVDNNSNLKPNNANDNDDEMTASAFSTFDTRDTENIVYRRKARKTPLATNKAPKKRVSFHEDILKNTRTDNIHIEHGFITYKNGRKVPTNANSARYSWCAEGQSAAGGTNGRHAELCEETIHDGKNGAGAGLHRRVVYRNACSDVLDYGNSDVYDTNEQAALQYDNSGVFEYVPRETVGAEINGDEQNNAATGKTLYRCSCSSSNSSLDSDEHDKNSNRNANDNTKTKTTSYADGQQKSSSCDCVLGNMNNANNNNNFINDNCYYSEPNIDNLNDAPVFKKSVWNKETKPKTSCLKKTKYHTSVIQEQDLSTKMKKFNVHDMNQLLDNSSKMLFGSLKSIFTMPLLERGVPEGSEDLQSVAECLSELEQTPDHKPKNDVIKSPTSPMQKSKPFLSKSLDGTKAQNNTKKFVHNVDEQLRRKNDEESVEESRPRQRNNESPALQRQTEFEYDAQFSVETPIAPILPTVATVQSPPQAAVQFRNKFIINCESTVFEHTGVSYEAQQMFAISTDNENEDGSIEVDDETALVVDVPDDDVSSGGIKSNFNEHEQKKTLVAQPEPMAELRNAFYAAPIAKTFSNFFRSFKEATTSTPNAHTAQRKPPIENAKKYSTKQVESEARRRWDDYCAPKLARKPENPINAQYSTTNTSLPSATSSSTISDFSTSTSSSHTNHYKQQKTLQQQQQQQLQRTPTSICSQSLILGQDLNLSVEKQSRHLASPLKKRNNGNGTILMQQQPQRYQTSSPLVTSSEHHFPQSDPFLQYNLARGGCGRDSKSTILSEEFDDILTITTTTTTATTTATDNDSKINESDIVIVDYPCSPTATGSGSTSAFDYGNLLKPPSAKTSLINRFLRNVTQKKILETSMRRNNFFANKLKTEQKLLTGQLYVRGVRGPKNYELIDDLNAEIAMEIEMSGVNSPRRELASINSMDLPGDASRFELGIGEISIDIFNGNYLHILRDTTEQLMKVFKLYTGYSREGFMTPVLVFLTDRALYVTDLVRNRLCTKFVLAYEDLDVILLGPYGNTVLLSNSMRNLQQVLLAGGPYPADGLVANLELCARRSGSTLPAVGQLTLAHLAPLRAFVREHSSVGRDDAWMYYAVVNVPAGSLTGDGASFGDCHAEKEPMGPHVKGFLMHRRVKDHAVVTNAPSKQNWHPGYFLLKAGVLYMFNDSMQKLPSCAMALAECQGARRAVKAGRPHCFEIMLRGGELLQMAAPDEYVASEWLQALLQSASGLFEMQEKHKTLGCTLVVTQNHLITLREDFAAPLRKLSGDVITTDQRSNSISAVGQQIANSSSDSNSVLNSAKSTPTKIAQFSKNNSANSTPTKLSQLSQSTTTTTTGTTTTSSPTKFSNTLTSHSNINSAANHTNLDCVERAAFSLTNTHTHTNTDTNSYSNMSSVYGKNSGVEILTCADIKEMTGIKIPSHNDTWWCILEFSCQEVRECTDDLVIFFASSAEMQRFLRLLEQLWQAKNNDLFPITVLDEDDLIAEQCTMLYMDINRSWEPLLSAALGYPL